MPRAGHVRRVSPSRICTACANGQHAATWTATPTPCIIPLARRAARQLRRTRCSTCATAVAAKVRRSSPVSCRAVAETLACARAARQVVVANMCAPRCVIRGLVYRACCRRPRCRVSVAAPTSSARAASRMTRCLVPSYVASRGCVAIVASVFVTKARVGTARFPSRSSATAGRSRRLFHVTSSPSPAATLAITSCLVGTINAPALVTKMLVRIANGHQTCGAHAAVGSARYRTRNALCGRLVLIPFHHAAARVTVPSIVSATMLARSIAVILAIAANVRPLWMLNADVLGRS